MLEELESRVRQVNVWVLESKVRIQLRRRWLICRLVASTSAPAVAAAAAARAEARAMVSVHGRGRNRDGKGLGRVFSFFEYLYGGRVCESGRCLNPTTINESPQMAK